MGMSNLTTPAGRYNLQVMSKSRQTSIFWLAGLLLVYWLTRLIALDGLAYFLDESNHLWWARWAWQGFPFLAASDGRLLNVLWMAAFWPFNAGVWVSRASVVLLGVLGVAATGASVQRPASPRAALLAMLVYIGMPLTFFFDRMALADSLSAPCVALAVWACLRLFETRAGDRRREIGLALIAGLALTAAVFSKISNLIFLCLPLLAAVCLLPPAQWRRGAWRAGAAYAACAVTLGPAALFVKVAGQSDLGLDILSHKTGAPLSALPAQLLANFALLGGDLAAYLPFPLWLLIAAGACLALWKGGRPAWFLAAALAVTAGILIVRTETPFLETRYLPAYAPLLAALTGLGLAGLSARRLWTGLAAACLALSGLPFMALGWTEASALPLPAPDRYQYIEAWPAGYGFREAALDLTARGVTGGLVTLELGGYERFEAYLLGRNDQLTAETMQHGAPSKDKFLVIDTPWDDPAVAAHTWRLVEFARYPRPGGKSAVVVYRVLP
jgi:4-amino-4-deoxy-L-arabinose transferase-like glycosyltransferase